ncbi:CAAX amino terminal membrane bound protease [Spiroplasma clarkii]|uniref:CAAX amino terminal membrane bound protease n=1 Tax=Spiroplasma clarkii TaxID=2139 RepID=A0A1Y0L3H5_9MOLU|nr:type II CAAX endopeptidase family protein [Spiroplasma clarkii]ARU92239.1 CAAX amino terminal membrane bound protease [Spiroplasma clarkii]ATX71559.1 CAAX amino terminal membrane bound protease [Spiroplasma clarkii]
MEDLGQFIPIDEQEPEKELNSFQKFQNKYYGLEHKFEFDKGNWKVNGMIFVVTAIIIPFTFSVIATLVFGLGKSENQSVASYVQILQIISIFVGFVVLIGREKNYIYNGKAWLFFYSVLPIAFAIALSMVIGQLLNKNQFLEAMLNIWIMIISCGTVLLMVFIIDKNFVKNFKESLSKRFLPLFLTALVGAFVLFVAQIGVSQLENLWAPSTDSNNQSSIIGILKGDDATRTEKTIYALSIFIYTVLIAPLIEEIVYRYCWNLNTSNRWFGFVTSAIAFGFVHYGITGDYAHALSYTVAGFVFSGVFLWTKGNTVACWWTHLFNNALSFIVIINNVLIGRSLWQY